MSFLIVFSFAIAPSSFFFNHDILSITLLAFGVNCRGLGKGASNVVVSTEVKILSLETDGASGLPFGTQTGQRFGELTANSG